MTDKKIDMLEAMKASAKAAPASKRAERHKRPSKAEHHRLPANFKAGRRWGPALHTCSRLPGGRGLIEQVDIITVTMLAVLALYMPSHAKCTAWRTYSAVRERHQQRIWRIYGSQQGSGPGFEAQREAGPLSNGQNPYFGRRSERQRL